MHIIKEKLSLYQEALKSINELSKLRKRIIRSLVIQKT